MENFDNRIREKLEEVRPPLPANAWASFKHLLPVPWYGILLQQYGTWLFGGLLTTGLLGSLFTNYQDNQQISKLNGEISTLKNSSQLTASTSTQIIERLRIDTVYVVKVVERLQENSVRDKVVETLYATSENTNERLVKSLQENVNPLPATPENKKNVESLQQNLDPLPVTSASSNTNTNTNERVVESLQETTTPENEEQKEVLEQFKKQFGTADTVQNKQGGSKKPFKLPKMFPRVGLETALGFNSVGLSPLIELFLTDNFSFSSGISAHVTQQESYPKPPDFNKATGKDFSERYQPKLPKHDRIEQIKITTSVVRLPIYLKYYVPFKKDFSFLFSLGTSLDLSVYQSINFESYLQGVETYRTIEDKPKPEIFSNLIFGSGLQYQRGRIIGQLQPYFDFNFKRADYKPKNAGNLGIKAGIFLDLSKK